MRDKEYKVYGFDSFSHEDFTVGSYPSLEEAKEVAQKEAGTMTLMYVYHEGKELAKYGTF